MKFAILHSIATIIFSSLIATIYVFEISTNWAYMGFHSLRSTPAMLAALFISFLYASLLSGRRDVRNFMLIVLHYVFFVPGLIISATYEASQYYFLCLILAHSSILISSIIPLRSVRIVQIAKRSYFYIVLLAMTSAVALIAIYGGLQRFNLNIFLVYDFRRDSAAEMPAIFGYFFSGVAKVIAPMTLALAIYFRSLWLAVVSMGLVVLLFGMTHHKSVLFLPFIVAAMYYLTQYNRAIFYITLIFIFVAGVSVAELLLIYAMGGEGRANFTSIIVRRVFFVPPLLDSIYVNYFLDAPKLLWSTSRFGLGLAENPYGLTAPFLIGTDVFSREGMSANTGIIGSGFSHAGVAGVAIYSLLLGLMISILQSFGKVIGHELVFAASVSIIMSVASSTDLTTAILTHGLLLLYMMLLIFPRDRKLGGEADTEVLK